jgi:hypothetical protein
MSGRDGEARPATFELERFAWGAPDRLELAGRFVGLASPPADSPVLVVRGAERTHRLAPAPDAAPGAPEDGRMWRAEFVWREMPEMFDTAQLQLGGDVTVELPAPGDPRPRSVEVRRTRTEAAAPTAGANRLRLEAELLAAREEAGELRAAAERAEQDLARARTDLAAEREGRAADAERFREGLARVQRSAEAALSEANDAVEALRAEVEVATAARAEAESAAESLHARMKTIRDALGDPG